MRLNREKFADFACMFYGQAVETDKRVYRLYLKSQLFANSFFRFAWMIIRALSRLVYRLCRQTPVVSVSILGVVGYRLVAGFVRGQFDTAPALVWISIFAILLGIIIGGSMLPRSTRDPGVEFAPRN